MNTQQPPAPRPEKLRPQITHWVELLPWIESVCVAYGGYFVLKIDGERKSDVYTAALNTPPPSDIILRRNGSSPEDAVTRVAADLEVALSESSRD